MRDLGAFSVSLAVQDLAASRDFYQALGFDVLGGDFDNNWLILRNSGGTTIGLFHGMFDENLLTFNPGWDAAANQLDDFEDVREIKSRLEAAGIAVEGDIDTDSGPAHFTVVDPDGNPILFDQHV
jgi:catechol 2,3-dioxygenase-like lactoylglutathione lyase family enzyme